MTWPEDDTGHILMISVAVLSIFSFFGVPANLLSIWLILRAKQKRSTTTCILLNLAIADVVNLLVALVVTIALFMTHAPTPICMLVMSLTRAPKHIADYSLSYIALERYNALVNTMKPCSILLSTKCVTRVLPLFWATGLIVHVPLPVVLLLNNKPSSVFLSYYIVSGIVTYMLPLFITILCYAKIFKGVFYDRTILGKSVTNEEELKDKKRFVRILIVVTVVFLITNLPLFVLKPIRVAKDKRSGTTLKFTMFILSFVSSTVNPYIYGLQSKKYREGVRKFFCHRTKPDILRDKNQCLNSHVYV